MSQSNKDLAKSAQSILKGFGYEVKLGHVYELMAKLSGFNSWNVANAKNAQFSGNDDPADLMRKDLNGEQVRGLRVSLTASATVELSTYLFPKDPSDTKGIKEAFLEILEKNPNNLDVVISEAPVAPHDFQHDDIEISEDDSGEVYVKSWRGVTKAVPGASVRLGEGPHVFEAKVKALAEAKVYLEIHAESEDQAKKLAQKFVEDGKYGYMDVIGSRDACRLTDWEVTAIEEDIKQPYVEYVWKKTK